MDGTNEGGNGNVADGATIAEPETDGDTDKEAGVNEGHDPNVVEAHEDIANKKSEQRKKESEATVFEDRA